MAGWIECVKEVVKGLVTDVLLPPVKCHLDYLLGFSKNIQDLEDQVRGLKRERDDVDHRMEQGRLRAESANPEVQTWSNESTEKLKEAREILRSGNELNPWNIIQRYLVGKSAKKTVEGVARLRNEGNSITKTYPANPLAMVPVPHEQTLVFESRKRIEDDIMVSLKNNNTSIIAICGEEGVGKTTMVKIIEGRVRTENLFDEVVYVVVGQPIDMLRIQKEMAEILGLKLREEFLESRAHKIRIRLRDEKRKLVIFDDVRENFKPMDIGVPLEGCKIILASRFRDVCEDMEAHEVVPIEVLKEDEARRLLSAKSGECNSELRPVEEVAALCEGLPLALVTAGKALRNRSIHAWNDWVLQHRIANAR